MKTPSVLLLTLVAAGCAPDMGAEPVWPDLNEGRSFTTVVTPEEGGALVTDEATLEVRVPPGAVDGATTLTVTVRPGEGGSLTSVYELGPEGITFARPVTVSLDFGADAPSGQRVVLAWADGDTWRAIPGSRATDDRIVGATRHFSRFAGRAVPSEESVYPWPEGQGDEAAMTYWTWTDPATGLTWQMPSAVREMNWQEAIDYCAGLYLDGDGWRLPNIDELRTLVRGCPATEPRGSCGVTDSCLELWTCYADDPDSSTSSCGGCMDGGCNWDPALFYEGETNCGPAYLSSSTYHAIVPDTGEPTPDDGLYAWVLSYGGAFVSFHPKTGPGAATRVRCVR